MTHLARIPLADGGCLLAEAPATAEGPVKAGRLGEVVHELPASLQAALGSVTDADGALLGQLPKAVPDKITVEFGVDLSFAAGAVITKSSANGHLKVSIAWERESRPGPARLAD
ncbi:CU044_2847 family protein [Streptomyces sp. NPDC127112]|uniref:CU044_2847 family protein n=1 Tax=Streptomyces sp. NPDC127112 TaxID=3345364 RepID=UPI00362C72EF